MFDEILVPTDGSQDMEPVVERSIEFAELCGARLHTLHVIDDRAYTSIPDDARDRVRDALEGDGQDATKTVAQAAIDADIEVVREVRWGNPPAAILAYTKEYSIDCILMGNHGRTGYERYLMGSVAEKIVRASPVPVFTIPLDDEDAGGAVEFPVGEPAD